MYSLKENIINNKHSYLLEYYNNIKSGEIISGHELIQELENLIEDLDNTEYKYDNCDAEFRINFIERFCKHTKSPFFGKPFLLELWEKAFIEAFYSFKWTETNLRRFKKAILLIARKNGKSTLCAAISLAEFFCGQGGNDIVCLDIDTRGLIMPIKVQGKPENRIDGAVTMIIGHAVLTQFKTEYMSLVNG